jgi:hypothetical protein
MKRIVLTVVFGFLISGCQTMYDFPGKTQEQVNKIAYQCFQEAGSASYGKSELINQMVDRCYIANGGTPRR